MPDSDAYNHHEHTKPRPLPAAQGVASDVHGDIPMNETGSCWNESPFGPGQTNGLLCELPSGHQGAHRAAESEWMVRDTAEPREPSDAHVQAARLAWLDARVKGMGHLDAMRSALHAAAKAGYKA